ncbi:cyanate permease [Paraburkholderia sp. BL27I4N3]|uniref:MFS transporter n=1 Tax=Paraburkholderia sp. BL27I4N3 TaxID=1938805 RepID=UPI000E282C27|nr:MFS transporter [Paraburkholderia sp. BL27I4N3]REE07520.1 cyanate permease [Paraburkholderia sp. BL27I4N3]
MDKSSSREVVFTSRDTLIMALLMVVAYMALGVAPILYGDLLIAGRVNAVQLSHVAAADYLSVGLASLFAPRFFSLSNVRRTAIIGVLLNTFGNFWSTQLSSEWLIAGRLVAGAGGGILIWLQYEFVARNARAERLSGLYLAAYVGSAVVVSTLASDVLVPRYGVNAVFASMGVAALVTGFAVLYGPKRMAPIEHSTETPGDHIERLTMPFAAILALLSVFFINAFTATLWIYFEPITAAANIPKSTSDLAAILSLVLQGGGAILAAMIAHRVRFLPVLIVCSVIYILQAMYILWGHLTIPGFLMFSLVFGGLGYFMVPFQIALSAHCDPRRRAVSIFAVPVVLGAGFGPLISSLTISDSDVSAGVTIALICSVLSFMALICAAGLGRTRPQRVPVA